MERSTGVKDDRESGGTSYIFIQTMTMISGPVNSKHIHSDMWT
jgi:hypothetical protein